MNATTTTDLLDLLIAEIKRGCAVRDAVQSAIQNSSGLWRIVLSEWFKEYSSGRSVQYIYDRLHYMENVNLLTVLEYGLQGYPILQLLESLHMEVSEREKIRMEQKLLSLPYKMMIPLFLFFLPALMWSFLAPFLRELAYGF